MSKIDRRIFDALDPAKMIPHGDRLLVEKVEVDNLVYVGERVIEIAGGDGDMEESRGYFFGRVVAFGDGHRLETPDFAVVVTEEHYYPSDAEMTAPGSIVRYDNADDAKPGQWRKVQRIVRVPATVPMPFRVGELLQIERFAGREITIRGKKYRQVNQIDVIAHVPELEAALDGIEETAPNHAEHDDLRLGALRPSAPPRGETYRAFGPDSDVIPMQGQSAPGIPLGTDPRERLRA